ncbi:hypothetical protein [Agromyces sp. NPDC058064]|uniref:hypothetical protein n=1 Tax=Agromyces sp. NPDC058064 TaxID=3346322 RepID=UPI0036DF3B55
MTTTSLPCVRGCVRAGTEDAPEVLPATHGRYCSRCYGRVHQALLQAPELAAHIFANLTPGGGGAGERVDSSKSAPLPFNDAAFADVNELYSLLVYWCGIWADYLDVLTPAAAARAWRRESGTVIGLPDGYDSAAAATEVRRMSRWLLDRLDEILTLAPEDVDEFDAAIRDVWRMNARWPRLERPRYSTVPCPVNDCGARLAVYPPAMPGAKRSILCDAGHFHGEDEYDDILAAIQSHRVELARDARKAQAAVAREQATDASRAAKVQQHLISKYLTPKEAS